ncbi:MAG: hypothetical protein JJU24_16880 [Natronohydrobacter sp.]|nr:hypothetical protein [Natronohydrobacter sp.]
MAYIDAELHNARLFWTTIRDRVLIVGMIVMAMVLASVIAAQIGHAPYTL